MKTKEELNALKNEVEVLSAKLAELTDDEMEQVTGGIVSGFRVSNFDSPRLSVNWGTPIDE